MTESKNITIMRATIDDIPAYRAVQAKGWRDVYPNDNEGVSREWVHEYTDSWLTPEGLEASKPYLQPILDNPDREFMYIARDGDRVIGMTHATNAADGQRLHAMYVDSDYYGQGIGQRLFDKVLQKLDPTKAITLSVVRYNPRAIRFYEKNGFEKIPGSESYHETRHPKLKLPVVEMIRKGDKA